MLGGSCSPCCGGGSICDAPPPYLRITVNGMPRVIDGGLQLGYGARSPFDDNGASHKMTPSVNPFGSGGDCWWFGGPHGLINRFGWTQNVFAWWLDARNDRLYGYGKKFAPPAGATFSVLPYTDSRPLVCLDSFLTGFGQPSDWSNVVISIDAQDTEAETGMRWTPCSAAKPAGPADIQDMTATVTVTGKLQTRRDYSIAAGMTFDYPIVDESRHVDMSFLSGDYDLQWVESTQVSPYSTSGPVYDDYAGPDGSGLVSQGFRFFDAGPSVLIPGAETFYDRTLLTHPAVLLRPTAFEWTSSTPGGSAVLNRCADEAVSYGVHFIVFERRQFSVGDTIVSTVISPVGSFYQASPCAAFSCGSSASLSVSGSMFVEISIGTQSSIIGTVGVSISAS